MASCQEALRAALDAAYDELLHIGTLAAADLSALQPAPAPDPRDVEQLTRAWLGVLREALDARSDEYQRLYYEVALTELVRSGVPGLSLLRGAGFSGAMTAALLLRQVPAPLHEEAARWFASFFAQHVERIARAADREEARFYT